MAPPKRNANRPAPAKAAAAKRATAKRKATTSRKPAPAARKRPVAAAAPSPPPPQPPSPPQRPTIRLAGSASSRLTIKPGPPHGPRPPLELSTKPRSRGQRPLSEVELDEDELLIDGFDAILEGLVVRITAVLERTCVYVDTNGDRRLASKKDLVIEADKLPIRRRGIG